MIVVHRCVVGLSLYDDEFHVGVGVSIPYRRMAGGAGPVGRWHGVHDGISEWYMSRAPFVPTGKYESMNLP